VWEFLDVARKAGSRTLESGGTSYGRGVAYLPVIALVRSLLDLDEEATATTIAAGLEAALGPAAPRFLASLLTLLDAPVDDAAWTALEPSQRRQRTLDAVRYLVLGGDTIRPLCLVVEDLHWIDPESQAVLDTLVDALPSAPVLLLVTYRPEYAHGWAGETYYSQVPVEPLTADSAERMTRALLGDDRRLEELWQRVIERTEGNPLFIEETVRHLVEAQELVGGPGAYRPVGRLRALEVPASVHAVLAARIDRLAPDEKRLLQVAAAIGKDFGRTLLEAVAELPSTQFGPALARLRHRQLIHENRLFPEVKYTFKHSLTHEVAYGTLVRECRRYLDRRIVEALEARGGEQSAEDVDRLARHALRGELWERAVRYCREAGTRAFARSAHRAAAAHFEQGLLALRYLPVSRATREEEVDILLDLRYALSPLGEYRRMLETLTEVERLAAELGDRRRLALASAFLASFFSLRGEFVKAIEHGRRALALADELGDTTLAVPARTVLSAALYLIGDYREAAALAGANAAVLTGPVARDRFGMALLPSAHSRTILAWSLAELGQFAGALEAGAEAMRWADETGHPHSQIFGALGLGLARLRRGDFAEAVAVLEHAYEIWQGADLPAVFLELAGPLASALASGGQAQQAIAVLERAVDMAVRLRHRVGHWLGSGGLAEAYLAAGRADEAVPRARMFVEMTRMVGARGSQAHALRLLGEATASLDPPDAAEAETALAGALARAGELGMRPLEAHCHLTLGRLYRRTKDAKRAEAELAGASTLFRTLEANGWLRRVDAEQAAIGR
jgi:tetratricopeptide (TPR) repeat protein